MISKKIVPDYWFTIEPYVYVSINNNNALLYNTLDGITVGSNKINVIELLQELLIKENSGVIKLTNERYRQKEINHFIRLLRENFMCDVIDITLSKKKPVQLLPFFNYSINQDIYRKQNFPRHRSVLTNLFEVSLIIDLTLDVKKTLFYLQSIPENIIINLIGDLKSVKDYHRLLSFLNQRSSLKSIFCSYKNIIPLQPDYNNNFSYTVSIDFPIDIQKLRDSIHLLSLQNLKIEYIFDVKSVDDYSFSENLAKDFKIENYKFNPIFNGENLDFLEEYVFLNKDDILSENIISMKNIFANQAMNIYDFGKINIMPNGDAYGNVNHPALGNIFENSILEIVSNELEVGKSWFRIRNEAPCNNCVYQWLCPSPSDLELDIGKPNLCHVK